MNKINKNKGFTLLEVLLVIAAIGILAAIVLVAINPNRQLAQARNLVRQADINTIQKALEQYLIDNGRYPNSVSTTPGYICNTGTEQNGVTTTNCSGRVDLRELVPTYIAAIPRDPQATGTNTGYNIVINPNNNKVGVAAELAESRLISINPYVINNGLVLHLDAGNPASYPGTGNTWFDLSGNNNNGTLVNGVGYNSVNGGSLVFDGVNDYVTVSNNITPGTGDFAVSVWVYKTETISNRYVWDFGSNGGTLSSGTGITQGFRYYNQSIGTGGSLYTAGPIHNINTWYNIVISRISGTTYFYSNGSLVTSGADAGNIGSWGTTLNIGRYGGGSGYEHQGRLSSLLVYKNKGLTPTEIQQNFNALRGRFGL